MANGGEDDRLHTDIPEEDPLVAGIIRVKEEIFAFRYKYRGAGANDQVLKAKATTESPLDLAYGKAHLLEFFHKAPFFHYFQKGEDIASTVPVYTDYFLPANERAGEKQRPMIYFLCGDDSADQFKNCKGIPEADDAGQ